MWAEIKLPHVSLYEDMFLSFVWTALMRILLPALACYTSMGAAGEGVRIWKSRGPDSNSERGQRFLTIKYLGLVIVGINTFYMPVIAFTLASGQYGPTTYLPFSFHTAAFFLFPSVSVSTTLVLGLVISEGMVVGVLESIVGAYRIPFVVIASTAPIIFDIGVTELASNYSVALAYVITPLWCAGVQAAAGLYYFTRARKLSSTLLALTRRPGQEDDNTAKKKRLVRWLHLAAFSMFFNMAAAIAFMAMKDVYMHTIEDAWPWLTGVFFFSLSRIAVAYSQVKLNLAPSQHIVCAPESI